MTTQTVESRIRRPATRHGFEIAIICALTLEADAVGALFDLCWDDNGLPFDKAPGDPNAYSMGAIGRHNVALAHMPGMGTTNAAIVANNCRTSFPNIKLALVVGVCGVVPFAPDGEEIILGDVIVSDAVIQYDLGRQQPDRFVRKDTLLDSLGRPNVEIRAVLAKLKTLRSRKQLDTKLAVYLDALRDEPLLAAEYPGAAFDKLFEATYCHDDDKKSCEQLGCNGKVVLRQRLQVGKDDPQPAVHFGLVASGNSVMKSGEDRDAMAKKEGVIAFEMEGTGVWDILPCVVIKGACDYADSHKSKTWQRYAAATAAAYMKAFLGHWVPSAPAASAPDIPAGPYFQTPGSEGKFRVFADSSLAGLEMNRHYAVPVESVQSYTERSELWKNLEEKLQIRHRQASVPYAVALQGFGGVGKSQLVLKYAESKRDRYNPILWIDATDEEIALSSFRRCAAELGLPDDQDEKRTSALADNSALWRVLRWLRDRKDTDDEWLAILDNADDFSWAIKDAMPKGERGRIIITSQDNRSHMLVPGGCERLEVGVMSAQEGTTLLLQRLDLHKEAATETIRMLCAKVADELGHLPLAMDLAGAYIGNDSGSPEFALRQYLEDYTTHRDELLKMDEFQGLMGTKKTVWTVWDTTLQRITKDTVQPRLLLRFLAQFKGTIIQDEMFGLAALGTPLLEDGPVKDTLSDETFVQLRRFLPVKGGKWDSFLYRQCRDLLVRYGLLQRVEGDWPGVTMHKLVQWRAVQSEQGEPWVWWYVVHVLAVCSQVTKAKHHPEFRRHLVVHLPDVDTVFSDMGRDAERYRDFVGSMFGRVYDDEGRWEEAEKLLVQVMEIHKTKFGPDHPDTLTSMGNLAWTYRNQGRWEEAEKLEVQVMETRKMKFGPDHPDTLTSMSNLASTYWNQGRWEEAEKLEVQVMETRKMKFGPDHPSTLISMSNLASTFMNQGRWEEAKKLLVQAMETRKTKFGPDHPHMLNSMGNLAWIYKNQGWWEEAEKLFMQVIEACKMKFGPDHPDTLISMGNLASTYRDQGRWEEAEKLEVQVMETFKTNLRADHPLILTSMGNLASTYRKQGRWEEAEKLEVQVMETFKTNLRADHPSILANMGNLALTYRNPGRWKEAEKLEVQVMEARKMKFGPDHPDTLTSMSNLASTYGKQGRWEEAEKLEVQVMETRKMKFGPDHPDTLTSMSNLASTYWNQGRWEEAEKLDVQVVEMSKMKLGANHPLTLTRMINLAATWKNMRRYQEALSLIQTCSTLRQRILGPDHPDTVLALQALIKWQKESDRLAEEG